MWVLGASTMYLAVSVVSEVVLLSPVPAPLAATGGFELTLEFPWEK
jgi:hypothetical protein